VVAMHSEMISFGAGVNSVAMTIMLVEKGWQGPIVFANPGSEHPDTYCYMESFERNYLVPRGLSITRIEPGSEYHERSDLPLYEFCMNRGIIPFLAVRWCSVDWKRNPLGNWRKAHGIDTSLLGIVDDEPHRVRDDSSVAYPLVEQGITRKMCWPIIQGVGLDVPRKSGCWFCPGQRLSQWKDLYLNHRDLFDKAVALEENASQHNQKNATLDPHGVPLTEMAARRWEGLQQLDLSHWLPCACSL